MSAGGSAAAFRAMNGPAARDEARWRATAASSLPVPDSPVTRTWASAAIAKAICSRSRATESDSPRMPHASGSPNAPRAKGIARARRGPCARRTQSSTIERRSETTQPGATVPEVTRAPLMRRMPAPICSTSIASRRVTTLSCLRESVGDERFRRLERAPRRCRKKRQAAGRRHPPRRPVAEHDGRCAQCREARATFSRRAWARERTRRSPPRVAAPARHQAPFASRPRLLLRVERGRGPGHADDMMFRLRGGVQEPWTRSKPTWSRDPYGRRRPPVSSRTRARLGIRAGWSSSRPCGTSSS